MLLRWGIHGSSRFFNTQSSAASFSSASFANANDFITRTRNPTRNQKYVNDCNKVALISCKRKEFNHYIGHTYNKFEQIPLASCGWNHKKSKGDYFIINGVQEQTHCVEDSTFEMAGISSELVKSLHNQEITKPTYIQEKSIPKLLSRYNALIAAETGCGKTLAYLLPVLQQILWWRSLAPNRQLNSPLALIITPSRELAQQIMEVAFKLTENMSVDCRLLTGGRTKRAMLHPTFAHVDVLVATLGALSKLTTVGIYKMQMVRHVVLDEADTLLDDSFIEKLGHFLHKFQFQYGGNEEKCTEYFPTGTQLTLVSATMPTSFPEVLEQIIQLESLKKITTDGLHHFLPHVPQEFLRLGRIDKPSELLKILSANKNTSTIVFSNKSSTCDWISMFLNENGIKCVNLNGDMPLAIRQGKFEEFQSGHLNVLSCTDVASRGLDTIRASLVINYDFPLHTADYIHRCGRIGRVGSPAGCRVINFVAGSREIPVVQQMEMSARQLKTLPKVDGNIANVIFKRILRKSTGMTNTAAEG